MVFNNNLLLGAGGQSTGPAPFDPTLIGNSVWGNGTDSRMDSPAFSAQSDPTCFTFATWIQINAFSISGLGQYIWSAERSGNYASISLNSSNKLVAYSNPALFTSDMVFRDIGWYHIICSYKGAANTVRMFVNGVEITNSRTNSLATNPEPVAFSHTQRIGAYYVGATGGDLYEANSYLAQTVFLDGFSFQDGDITVSDFLDTYTFGTNGSQFIPKKDSELATLAGTAGANSYVLDYADSANLGNDISSKNNDFTVTNISSANQSTNTPSKVYPTFNPLTQVGTSKGTFSEGNTKVSLASDNGAIVTTPLPNSGMWYWEIDWSSGANGIYPGIALQSAIGNTASSPHVRSDTFVWLAGNASGQAYDGSSLVSYVGSATSIGRIAVAFDADNTAMYFGTVSGSTITWLASGDPTSGPSKTGAAPFTLPTDETLYLFHSTGNASIAQYLFEEDDWTGVTNRPANAKSLNSANLPAPDYQGIDYFDATLYEGNGTGQRVGDFVPFTDAYTVANSAMFNSADLRYLARTPSSGGNEKTLTFSTWIKITGVGNSNENAVLTTDDGSKQAQIRITGTTLATKKVQANLYNGSSFVLSITTDRTFGDTSSWNHLVVAYDTRAAVASADKVIIYINGVRQSVSGTLLTVNDYETEFNSTNEHNIGRQTNNAIGEPDFYLAETVMIDGQQLDATSFGQLDTSTNRWIPKDVSGLTFGTNGFYLEYGGTFGGFTKIDDSSSSYSGNMTNGGGLSAAFDGNITKNNAACAQGANTNSNDSFIVVDHGSAKTVTQFIAYASQDIQGFDGDSGGSVITFTLRGSTDNFSTSDVLLYTTTTADGAGKVFTVSSGITSGAYQYHKMTVQTNTTNAGQKYGQLAQLEYYIDAATDAGTDTSGNSNNWTESTDGGSAWATSDQFTDTPSKNFPTFDPANNGAGTLSEGNTKIISTTDQRTTYTDMVIPSTGKWYWEVDTINYVSGGGSYFGVVPASTPLPTNNPSNGFTDQVVFETFSGNSNFYSSSPNGGTTWCNTPGSNNFVVDGDVLQFALDQDAGTFFIGNNNTWYRAGGARDTFSNATTVAQQNMPTGIPRRFIYGRGGSFAETYALNFGQQANTFSGSSTTFNAAADGYFVYTPPTGYKALNQDNLDDTASKITALAWIKNREAADNHMLFDRVRGVGKDMHSNDTAAEVTNANTVQRFLQRGVQIGSDVEVNTANESYVLWQWLLGDSATTGSANTDGSITSTVIAADAGHFSICTYTGTGANATIGHGLSGAPELVIVKNTNDNRAWRVLETVVNGGTHYLTLNTFAASTAGSTFWNDSNPTASVINLGSDTDTNDLGDTMLAISFRSVPAVCKVGSYIGNGNADGPYISVGFRPSYVLAKSIGVERWVLHDTARSPINVSSAILTAETNLSEATLGTTGSIDILADGFKCRDTDGRMNNNGVTYIYVAMADIGGNGTLPPVYGR